MLHCNILHHSAHPLSHSLLPCTLQNCTSLPISPAAVVSGNMRASIDTDCIISFTRVSDTTLLLREASTRTFAPSASLGYFTVDLTFAGDVGERCALPLATHAITSLSIARAHETNVALMCTSLAVSASRVRVRGMAAVKALAALATGIHCLSCRVSDCNALSSH
jgi:hypothetical protein